MKPTQRKHHAKKKLSQKHSLQPPHFFHAFYAFTHRNRVGLCFVLRVLLWMLPLSLLFCIRGFLRETELKFPFFLAVLLLLMARDLFFTVRSIKTGKSKHTVNRFTSTHLCLIFFNAFATFRQIEYLCNDSNSAMVWNNIIRGILITAVIYLCLVLVSNSLTIGMCIGNIFFLVWALASYFVLVFRETPLQFSDLAATGTAMEVAGSYSFEMTGPMVQVILVTVCFCIYYIEKWDYRFGRIFSTRIVTHVIGAASCVLCYILLVHSTLLTDMEISLNHWTPLSTYRTYGTETAFFAFAEDLTLKKPENYETAYVKQLSDTAVQDTASGPLTPTSPVTPTNIILIMDESWCDFTIYENSHLEQDYLPFYHSLTENTIKGNLYVSTWAAGTDRSEYEVLTGHTMAFSPHTHPYSGYFTSDHYSLVSTLKDQGYTTIAMHPNKATNWNRKKVYDLMGFDKFLSIDDFDGIENPSAYDDPIFVRSNVSDLANFEWIEKVYEEKKEGEPFFLFNVTMQNHGGYTVPDFESTCHLSGYTGEQPGNVEQYLTLASGTDAALEQLITYFSAVDEPTMICVFGDHPPAIPQDYQDDIYGADFYNLTIEQQQKAYVTPYFLWANYPIPSATNFDLSSNYLGSYLLKTANLKLSPYQEYLLDLQQKLPVLNAFGYIGLDGQMHAMDEEGREELSLINDYYCLIYNELKGGKNRVDSAFTISPTPTDTNGMLAKTP